MSDGTLRAMLDSALTARIAWLGEDGPRLMPIWFLWDQGAFWFETGATSPIARATSRRPSVAVEIGDEHGGLRSRSIVARGDLEQHADEATVDRVVEAILAKYLGAAALSAPSVQELRAAAHVALRLPVTHVIARDETGAIAPLGPLR